MEYRAAKRTESGGINLELLHPVYGWIPFYATPDDPERHGRLIYEIIDKEMDDDSSDS